jgi:hypothetical protein
MHSTKRDAVLVVVFLSVVACQRRDAPTASTAADHSGTPASDHTGHTLVATASGNSSAMGTWRPGRFDSCTAAVHDQFAVTGPDGKRYPTWHPPVDPATGCTFGHEHGRDPRGSKLYALVGAVPFGVANEALLSWQPGAMRHEDHVGHKVEWENDVQLHYSVNGARVPFGVTCDWMAKLHQGTHSPDALVNNTHEIFYTVRCSDGTFLQATVLSRIDRVARFERGCAKGTFVKTDLTPMPGQLNGRGTRLIPDRTCADKYLLVPAGRWSSYSALYEDWVTSNYLRDASGRQIAYFDPHFAVFNPARYHDPRVASRLSYALDLCYERIGSGSTQRRTRGGECDWGTNYGQLQLTWDDPRSPFNGSHRETYFNQTTISNAGGPATWYTDPFGGNASRTPFTGSIAQRVASLDNTRPYPLESQAVGANRPYGGQGVHAPN